MSTVLFRLVDPLGAAGLLVSHVLRYCWHGHMGELTLSGDLGWT